MPRKKFNKKEGLRFSLMHRSQQDPLYHDDENGSRYILHPADAKTAAAMEDGLDLVGDAVGASYVSSEAAAKSKRALAEKRKKMVGPLVEYREVDEMGLPIDGYDYSQHLSEMGGGVFIAPDGTKLDKAPTLGDKINAEEEFLQMLPETVFASKTEHPRLLEAITLNADDMDYDMKIQLGLAEPEEDEVDDDDSDGTGVWGDLQDDFMEQIISSGVVEKRDDDVDDDDDEHRRGPKLVKGVIPDGFDFDAHMARLMKEAEAEDEDEDEDDEDFDLDGLDRGPRREMRDVDKHFEAVLAAEYDDDDDEYDEDEEYEEQQIGADDILDHIGDDGFDDDGDLHEGEEEEEEEEYIIDGEVPTSLADLNALMKGSVSEGTAASKRKANELETRSTTTRKSKRGGVAPLLTQDDPVFLSAVQEFLQEKRADATLGLVANPPSAKETLAFVQHPVGKPEENQDKQVEGEEATISDDENERPSIEEFMKLWGTYSVTEKAQFDCATIVSTRSTTDNIPSEIVVENTKKKKKQAAKMAAQVIVEEDEAEVASTTDTIEDVSRDIAQMALSGVATRRKEETAEERKARKALVKDLRRERRSEKRQTKEAFKRERSHFLQMVNAPGAPKLGLSEFKLS